eukprot:CAMPEP_0169119350 /NCGR_PEP_ID=MMETSP1015-20121227/31508_1 /TAXON_ID=342587 /ORGANISM="Karlodinium micrum, Strain CCMP2283" /LENGTH=45 /DNA_ID= /DNA_START= /DNA_END= /DNA_ORIENTATION=
MKTVVAIVLLVSTAKAANLMLSFQDCGDSSTDAAVTDVEPKSLPT